MSLLRELRQLGVLRTVDDALARTLARLDASTPGDVLAAAALASLAVANGHAAFDLKQPQRVVDADVPWPDATAWAQVLAASRFVATPASTSDAAANAPLVLEHGLLYLRRYREYERRLALRLRALAQQPVTAPADAVAALFAQLFPEAAAGDLQARAADLALRQALLLMTGGPGTGKTTAIARLLVLRIAQARHAELPAPRIALAAPTGRAADRMLQSLQRAAQQMAEADVDVGLLQELPTTASTLHRLLGVIPNSPQFRHHADQPLADDIVVVDEASMVDLPLMCKLVEAVAAGTQLILLGDADQLPSVEAGDVLASVLRATDAVAPSPMHGHRVHLVQGWRQHEALQLAPLADAMRVGDADTVLELLRGGTLSQVHYHEHTFDPLQAQPSLLAHWRELAHCEDPVAALHAANRLRLLVTLHDGAQGTRSLNARIEALLSGQRIGSPPAWFRGRLLLITENSPRHGLFNGDVGICLPDACNTPVVWFADGNDARAFHPATLPAHESAFAMTVHKAQGSEFDTVWLQLPQYDARVLSRELLYTAVTRARDVLHIAGSEGVLRAALKRHASRVSGLEWRLL